MPDMRVSVTSVDGFHYYQQSDMSLDDFLRRLRKQEPPTDAMEAGKAFHSILENASGGEIVQHEHDGWQFDFDLDCELRLPDIREIKGEKLFCIDGINVTLVGVVDALGAAVYDHKLSSQFKAERYMDAFQWRAYLSMFERDQFTYNVFTGSRKGRYVKVRKFDALSFYRYPAMEQDVIKQLSEFVAFCCEHFPESVKEAA